jgi:hypothetical protein
MELLKQPVGLDDVNEIITTPIFTGPVRDHAAATSATEGDFCQYGLLGGICGSRIGASSRLFYNVATPSSTFICGSQGSGKSHTLSCLLENCLLQSSANTLPSPLAGIVFHYDTFMSDHTGAACEAAYLSSSQGIKVRVLCPPSNVAVLRVRRPTTFSLLSRGFCANTTPLESLF